MFLFLFLPSLSVLVHSSSHVILYHTHLVLHLNRYGISSDDDNRARETKALPFQAYGALGMAREEDPDSGSSQFFFLKWLQALVAPGRNTLDGYYACMGYVVQNEDVLKQLQLGDKIVYAKVIEGLENFSPSAVKMESQVYANLNSVPSVPVNDKILTSMKSSIITTKVSKAAFLEATKEGAAIDVRNKAKRVETQSLERKLRDQVELTSGPEKGTVRLVDLGGSRGARGLATDGVQGGSLIDQLKQYGGEG